MSAAPKVVGIARAWKWCASLTLAFAAVALMLNFASYAAIATRAVEFPYQLDYGEGIVWQQMRLMFAGRGYSSIDGFPAIVFHYPPGFHLGTGLLAELTGIDQLAAGRLVSLSSTLVIAFLIGAIVVNLTADGTQRSERMIGGLLAAGTVFTFQPVQVFSFLMRVDMLSFAFGFAGFYFALLSLTRPKAVYIAAVFFVLAIYTKQTAIAAPAAAFLVLLRVRQRTALVGIATCLSLGLAALALLSWTTEGRFLHHIVGYNLNRFERSGLAAVADVVERHCGYLGIVALVVAGWSKRALVDGADRGAHHEPLSSRPLAAARLMALTYLGITTLMLVSAMKSGSYVNYFIEWCCTVAIFVGLAEVEAARLATRLNPKAVNQVWASAVPFVIAVQALFLAGKADERFAHQFPRRREFAQLASLVHAAPAPVIGDDMVAIMRGGKPVVWEPAIFAELASLGVWDERPFIAKIRARQFAFFISQGRPGDSLFDHRYTPRVTAAVLTYYPVACPFAGYTLRFPQRPLPAYAAFPC